MLRESGEVYRTLIETSPDPIIMYDLTGRMIAANTQAAKTYGVSTSKEFLNEVKTVFNLLSDAGKADAEANFRRTLTEDVSQRNEYQIKVKKGKLLDTEAHSSIVYTVTGEPTAFISVIRDII